VDDPPDNAIAFHLAQLLDQHLLRDAGNRPFEFREAQHLAAEQVEQDQQLPLPFKNPESLFDCQSSRGGSPFFAHTFR